MDFEIPCVELNNIVVRVTQLSSIFFLYMFVSRNIETKYNASLSMYIYVYIRVCLYLLRNKNKIGPI